MRKQLCTVLLSVLGKYIFHILEAVQLTRHVVSVTECQWEATDMFKGTLHFYPGNG